MVEESWVFDRVADVYDATRGYPAAVGQRVTELLLEATGAANGARFVEVGVGTGRIAKPLARRVPRVVGVDLSLAMMGRARGVRGLHLVRGDAARLPLPDHCCDVVVAVHVFHLIGAWRQALAEAWRVLKTDGALACGIDDRPRFEPNLRDRERAWCAARGLSLGRPGIEPEELHELLAREGFVSTTVGWAEWPETSSPRQRIEDVRRQTHSHTWRLGQAELAELCADLEAWVREQRVELDAVQTEPHRVGWQVWRRG